MDILFKNATVVTMNPSAPILNGVDVGISGRKISYISQENPGTALESESVSKGDGKDTAARVIDCTGKVLMPGGLSD